MLVEGQVTVNALRDDPRFTAVLRRLNLPKAR